MPNYRKFEVGNQYGLWTVMAYRGNTDKGHARWQVICECGREKTVTGNSLRSGNSRSCGSYACKRKTHGVKVIEKEAYDDWLGQE